MDTSYLSQPELRTLAEDQRYQKEIEDRHPTIFFRSDDRTQVSFPTYLHVDEDGMSYIGFISEYGSHAEKKPPVFLPKRIRVEVLSRQAKKISEITDEECKNSYKELMSPEAVLMWLVAKYPDKNLTPDSIVTVYTVEYT